MYYLVSCLRNFEGENLEGGYSVTENDGNKYIISKSHPDIMKIITNNNYIAFIGSSNFQELASNYFSIKLIDSPKMNEEVSYTYLSNFLQYLETLCMALWFVKDNAVTPSMGTLSSDSYGHENYLIRRNVFITNSIGYPSTMVFSKKEMDQAIIWYEQILKIALLKGNGPRKVPKGYDNLSNLITFDVSSFQRAFYFLSSARKADFLLTKITNYISILECLLASNGDNTQKVSERAAVFISINKEERKEIFRRVSTAYDVRSKYVHGSEIKKGKHEQIPEISKNMDDIVRKVFKELLLNHPELNYNNSNKKDKSRKNFDEVNDWFNDLVLTKEV